MAEELAVEVEADLGDVTGLFGAEEVAGTADFEIAHGDFEAGAEGGVLFDGVDAFAGIALGDHFAGEEEDGVGFFAGAADAAPELVEIGEAEAVGAVDEDGVGVGDVDASFDDGGGEEDIGFVVDEGVHDGFEIVFVHLAVADEDACFGDEFAEGFVDGLDGFDAVVEEEDLAAAFEFAADGIADDALVIGDDGGGDGESVGGWGVDG